MRFSSLLAATAIFAAASTEASEWVVFDSDSYTVTSCYSAISKAGTFCVPKTAAKSIGCACKNQPAMASLLQCLMDRTDKNLTVLEEIFIDKCADANKTVTMELLEASYKNASSYWIDLDEPPKGYNKSIASYVPIKNGNMTKYFHGFYVSNDLRYTNLDKSHYMGIAMLAAWALLLLIATIHNWSTKLVPTTLKLTNNSVARKCRQYIGLAPTFKKHHIQSLGLLGYVPARSESLWMAINFLYLLFTTACGYQYNPKDLTFTKGSAISRYVGDRSAIILSYMTPLVFLFPGRNNFLQWCTGWSFSRFVTYHKWLARFYVAEIIIHSGAMAVSTQLTGKWVTRLAAAWYRWGIVGTVASGFMIIFAGYSFRKFSYEAFLIIHIVLAAIFLVGAWIHAEDQEYMQYYYAAAAVWCFDAAVRLGRVAVFGVRKAKVELIEGETLKVVVSRPSYWKPYPGAHGFVHFITPLHFFQSHPFTFCQSTVNENDIHFYIKVKNGVTKALAKKITNTGSSTEIYVSVEGPYGERNHYEHYDKAVLVAGGNGIPGIFSHAVKLGSAQVEKTEVKLYWSIREYHSLNWFREELSHLKGLRVQPIVYVSNPQSSLGGLAFDSTTSSGSESEDKSESKEVISTSSESQLAKLKESFSYIEFRTGRMNLEEVISQEVEEANGSIAIGVCGHPAMADQARVTVANKIGSTDKRIDYFEEMQIW